jgi:DNA (cytosine-5)-methyltransferase 1
VALLPTPGKADGDGGHLNSEGFQSTLPGVARDMALLPSPRTSDTNGAGRHGDGGMDLRTAVAEIGGLCDGCNVRGAWEHRCHGEPCSCPDCREERRLFGEVTTLLSTPAVNDMGAAYTPETWDEWTATMKAKHNNGNGHGKPLNVEAQRLLPTPTSRDWRDHETQEEDERRGKDTLARALHVELLPTLRATDGTKGGPNQRGSSGDLMLPSAVSLLPTPMAGDAKMARNSTAERRSEPPTGVHAGDTLGDISHADRWGEYGPAILRWELITRPAPEPTKLNSKGNPKLSDEFDEWLMGYPAGWITDVPGVTWNEALKACGNGVVPQQGADAVRWLMTLARAA